MRQMIQVVKNKSNFMSYVYQRHIVTRGCRSSICWGLQLSLFKIYRVRKYDDNKKNWVWTTISEIIYFFLNDHIEFVGKINLKYPERFLRLQDKSDCLLFDYEIVRTCLNEIQDVVVSESSQVLRWRLEWGATMLYSTVWEKWRNKSENHCRESSVQVW